jgi:hypothetical protein
MALPFRKSMRRSLKINRKKGDIVVVDANLVSEGQSLLKVLKYL